MASVKLTEGAIASISCGNSEHSDIKPLLQVADLGLVNTRNQNGERYRILLSDGKFVQQGMLLIQCNDLVKSEKLQKGSIVRLLRFDCIEVTNRKVIIVYDLAVILENCKPIGRPEMYQLKSANASSSGENNNAAPMHPTQNTYEQTVSAARESVFGIVDKIGGLRLQKKLLASKKLADNTKELELFLSLPDVARAEYVRMMLAGEL